MDITSEACQAACAQNPSCFAVIHREINGPRGACTGFPNCDATQKSKFAFRSWKKVKKGPQTPAPTPRQPDPTPNPTPNPTPSPTHRQPDPTPTPTPAPDGGSFTLREGGGCLASQGFGE